MKRESLFKLSPVVLGMIFAFALVGCKNKGQQSSTGSSGAGVTADSLVAKGKRLYTSKGCVACHSLDGSKKVGPSFKGVYGHEVEVFTNGKLRKIKVDDAYLKRSILKPKADLVKGYEKGAPMVTVPIKPEEADALVAFIKSLK